MLSRPPSPPNSTHSSLPDTGTPDKSWLGAYESFLIKNASQISSVESALNNLTYVFPGRFKDAETISEVVYSALGILGLYHDTLISRALSSGPKKHDPSLHSRYTHHFLRNRTYKRIAYLLAVIQKTELLLEIVCRRRGGERAQHAAVLGLESVKAACRLALLRITNSRTLVSPVVPEREIDPKSLDPNDPTYLADQVEQQEAWTMPRTGMSLPVVNSKDINAFLYSRVLFPDNVVPAQNLMHTLSRDGQFKETLYILSPLIYVLLTHLAMKLRDNRSTRARKAIDWMPWVIGFALEYGCRDGVLAADGGVRTAWTKITGLEQDELKKRGSSLWWWTLRGQFYRSVTKPVLDKLVHKTSNVPLINLVGLYVADYQYLLETYYFSTKSLP